MEVEPARYRFNPNWVVAPGDILADELQERGVTVEELAATTGLGDTVLHGLIAGTEPLTDDIAGRLSEAFGMSAQLWINLERTFRDGLEAGKTWMR